MDTAPTSVIWVSASGRANATGTAADPFNSIQAAVDHATAGTAIMVRAGVYTENVRISHGGTADALLQIISADGAGAAEVKPASQSKDTIEISKADYVTIDGLKIAGPASATANGISIHADETVFDPATHIIVENTTINAGYGDGIKASKAEYVSLLNNTITGSMGIEEGIDSVGVHHLVIANNSVAGSGGIGIAVKGGSYDVLIENNRVDGTTDHGIGVGGYTEESYFWPGFIGSDAYEVKDIKVIGNEIEHTTDQGIRVLAGQNVEIADNWIHDVAHQYAIGVSPAGGTFHTPAWVSQDVTFDGNYFDKADWLHVDNAQTTTTTLIDNQTLAGAPPDWVAAGPVPVVPVSYDYVTAASFVLPSDSAVLHLFTANPTATTPIDLTGNSLPQTIEGNAGNNVIDGKGGIDAMYGYGGDDTYFVDHPQDAVYEAGNAGFDTVYSAASYVLTSGQSIEKLAVLSAGGAEAINLTGNDLAQAIYGNVGDNVLDGKAGADSLYGYAGNDTYYLDDAGDLVFEAANSGFDTVLTNTTYQLGAGQSIERLVTTSPTSTGGIKLTGNELDQQIVGNAGANVIDGKAGNDILTGGAGADTFVFDTALSAATNVDTIADFVVVDDTIRLENDVFTTVGKSGALSAAAFNIGPAAGDADDRIIYDSAIGNLYYDADGTGAIAAVLFSKTSIGLAMTAADFMIV
jgi:hypothetical protein